MKLYYFINLDERGEFRADVRTYIGDTIFEIDGHEIFEDGYMRNSTDIDGLLDYMIDLDIASIDDEIVLGE